MGVNATTSSRSRPSRRVRSTTGTTRAAVISRPPSAARGLVLHRASNNRSPSSSGTHSRADTVRKASQSSATPAAPSATRASASILSSTRFVYGDGDGGRDAADMGALLDLVSRGRLQVEIGHRGDWAGAGPLRKRMAAGRLRGKAVLSIG